MCGLSIGLLFEVAIGVIIFIAVMAMLAQAFPGWTALAGPYGNILRILVFACIAIVVVYFLWRMVTCASGHVSNDPSMFPPELRGLEGDFGPQNDILVINGVKFCVKAPCDK